MSLFPFLLCITAAAAVPVDDALFVLAIGVNDAGVSAMQPLAFADDDAVQAAQLFTTEATYLHTRMDAKTQARYPTQANRALPITFTAVQSSIESIANQVESRKRQGKRSQVVLWISGHASYNESGNAYFPLRGKQIDTAVFLEEIVKPLAVAHRVHLIIDTCFAESLIRARAIVQPAGEAEVEAQFWASGLARFPNVGALIGSTAGTRAYEWEEIEAGVFSAMVRAGLRGAADANQDETIGYFEIDAFLASVAHGISLDHARPQIRVIAPALDRDARLIHRAWVAGEQELATADLAKYGVVHIVDDRGIWVLAANFEPGYSPTLWLPSGPTLYLREGDQEHQLQADGDRLVITDAAVSRPVARSLIGNALRDGLFRNPYGPSFYAGYEMGRVRARDEKVRSVVERGSGPSTWLYSGAMISGGVAITAAAFAGAAGAAMLATDIERIAFERAQMTVFFLGVGAVALVTSGGLAVAGHNSE